MPQMANIVIKAADGVAAVTYTAKVPSAGDKSPAVWKNDAVGTVNAAKPSFTFVMMDNGTRKARRARSSFIWPKTRTDVAGNVSVVGGASGESSHLIPQDMTVTEINEYCAQYANLLASTLVQACLTSGYAPS